MVAGYTRQAAANIQPGLRANAEDCNAEWNQLATAFDNTAGHDHSGSVAGDGVKIPLGSAVTGVLPVANGGTGSNTSPPTLTAAQFNPGGVLVGTAGSVPGTGSLVLNQNTVAGPAVTYGGTALRILGPDGGQATVEIESYGNAAVGPILVGRAAAGTATAPTALGSGAAIMSLYGVGATGPGTFAGGPAIVYQAAEAWSGGANGSALNFNTTPLGTTAAVQSLRLQGNAAVFSGTLTCGPLTAQTAAPGQLMGSFIAPNGSNAYIQTTVTSTRTWSIGTVSDGRFAVIDVTGSNAARFIIDLVGTTSNTSGTWATISDTRAKENVQPYTAGLAEISALEPITYDLATGLEGMRGTGLVGFAAEQVNAVMPELCGTATHTLDGAEVELMTAAPTGVVFALVNAVKELASEVAALKAKVGA